MPAASKKCKVAKCEHSHNVHEFYTQQASHVKENALAMLHKTDNLPRIFYTIECLWVMLL